MGKIEPGTVADIVRRAGGAQAIVEEFNIGRRTKRERLTVWAVYKWPQSGIPDHYWPLLIKRSGVTPDEVYHANRLARATSKAAA